MIVDCHAHFEPRMLDLARVIEKLDAAGVDRVALIPAMNGPLPKTPEALLDAARVMMSSRWTRPLAERVHRATLTSGGDLRLGGEVVPIYRTPDNEGVARVVAERPDRFMGWIFLNPAADPDVLDTLERWRAVPGMVGVKLHPHWHDYEVDALWPLLARAEELRMPALIHLGFGRRGDVRAICERFPRLTVISAHAGFPFYKDLWKLRGALPRLYVDLSSPYINERLARAAVAAMGPERCLYGTDAPYGFHGSDGSYDYGEIRAWVERLPITARERDGVFGETFLSILDRSA